MEKAGIQEGNWKRGIQRAETNSLLDTETVERLNTLRTDGY